MSLTLTNVTITSLQVNCSGGPQTLVINWTGTDSAGNVRSGTYTKALTAAQQTSITNFLNNLIAQAQADLNLTVTIG